MIRQTIWRVIWVGLATAIIVLSLLKARALISTLVIAFFLSLAMDPAISALNAKRGWSRGRAAGFVLLTVVVVVVLLVTVLVPALIQVTQTIAGRLPGWISSIEQNFGVTITGKDAALGDQLDAAVRTWLQDNGRQALGLAGSTVGVAFQLFTTITFTLYFAADAPKIRQALFTRMRPQRQQRIAWAWDTAITQTGGYFYSRLLLMGINSTLFFVIMVVVGVPWLVTLPLAAFQGFFAEFIPVVGTYIGAAVPIVVTLGIQGIWQAAVLTGWTVVYQQIENYWLSPRISAQTMEINGAVAFGSALAGGAIAGPMGAFMAMPLAALVTSFVKHYVPRYELAGPESAAADAADPDPEEAADPEPTVNEAVHDSLDEAGCPDACQPELAQLRDGFTSEFGPLVRFVHRAGCRGHDGCRAAHVVGPGRADQRWDAAAGFRDRGNRGAFSVYSYAKLGWPYPSRGDAVVYLRDAFGEGLVAGGLNASAPAAH